jgi:hypothetical protein
MSEYTWSVHICLVGTTMIDHRQEKRIIHSKQIRCCSDHRAILLVIRKTKCMCLFGRQDPEFVEVCDGRPGWPWEVT